MHKIKHALALIILTVCPLAYGIDVDIAGETIHIPSPAGFTEVRTVSQDTFAFFQDMCPEQNRLLAAFVTKNDSVKLISGTDADFREYMTVQCIKSFDDMTLTKQQFGELRDMFRKEYDSLFQNKDDAINQAASQVGTALSQRYDTNVKFDINGVAPLGVNKETATSISMSQLTKYDLSMSGENTEHMVAGTMTATLVKGKLLYIYVFRTYQDEKDVEWTQTQSDKWIPTIKSSNEETWPISAGGIVPAGTTIDAGTRELISKAQVEYNMKLHPKALGLDISIKYPESWKAEEAIRPHIVQKFTGESVAGIAPSCMLIVQDIPTWGTLLLESELGEDVLIECLHEMVPPNATYLDGGATRIDGESGVWLKYYYEDERAGMRVGMYSLQYVLFYSGKMLAIQCAVGGVLEDKEMLEDAFASYLPVFQLIGNSAVIHEKWTQSDHYSFREHVTGWSMVIIFLVVPAVIALGFGVIRPKRIPIEPLQSPTPLTEETTSPPPLTGETPPPLPKNPSKPPPLPKEGGNKNV
jgi:hypothetical protein